ncbi:PhzF family phenazine biosynthesis protein [Streptacidiphilus melanogenes]|uniref:PhzF family phenazine biosynthesis protein n=1 Tax=Streptacidiphilus melanogenes TaxID=411235 RepID=UPI0005A8A63D|nr:PhzF family phenazine biosynthesis isomerase [Streptacidiphilus melanogenes]
MTSLPRHRSDRAAPVPVTVVHACLRDGSGGSPTAVVAECDALDDAARRRIPALARTSHAVFVDTGTGDGETAVRFFTAEGELPACGHGTVAALAYLAEHAGMHAVDEQQRTTLRSTATGQPVEGLTARQRGLLTAEFAVAPVTLREPATDELSLLLPALGLPLVRAAAIATLGRPRLLVRAPSAAALRQLAPDLPALDDACRELDLLGCYVYAGPATPRGRLAARMFAPAIGVPEDIANANSTACLATALHASGGLEATASRPGRLAVDMGDSVDSPATITATVATLADGSPQVWVGGTARVGPTLRLDLG